ncbi:MAG: DNA translocase FtsK [Phycisphaeraceae bacterium]|nr:DNA translocase FtsK [Phycisphaeraceae bacterium]
MSKKQDATNPELASPKLLKVVCWSLALCLWLLVSLALVSFHPADPPGYSMWPVPERIHNWIGQAGAVVSHTTLSHIGPGAWMLLLAGGSLLWACWRGGLDQWSYRVVGLLLAAWSISTLAAWWNIDPYQFPEGPGGYLGVMTAHFLAPRFGEVGTPLLLMAGFLVGMIVWADYLLVALGRRISAQRDSLPHLFALAEGLAALVAAPFRVVWAGLSRLARSTERKAARAHDLDDGPETLDGKPSRATGAARWSESVDGPEPEIGEIDEADPGDDEAVEPESEPEEEPAHDPAGTFAQSRRAVDLDELRSKIKQLPINFAPKKEAGKSKLPREVDLTGYQFPSIDMLAEPETNFNAEMEQIVREQALQLESALLQYRIEGEVVGIDSGPVITLFEVRLAPGTKVNRINNIASDIARALKAQNIRVVPNSAGKDTIGIEVPNLKKEKVRLKELMTVDPEGVGKMKLPMFLGKDGSGNPLIQDLASMPHMLIAGTTGSGKSVCMNSIIMSFLFTRRPDELKLVLVDPKMVEMSLFKDIPHLMCPVVTEMAKAASILEWAVTKMDERYELLLEAGVRDISGYNGLTWEQLKERINPSDEDEEARIPRKLPYMVLIIDELADLMMTNKEVESYIVRIAQKARAVGIHLILATQRPQANVVTGLIKGNMPCRVSFQVSSALDSRIVLDQKGAELLLGQGDMLFLSPRSHKLARAQGTLVDDMEIRKVVKFLTTVAEQNFEPQLVQIRSAGADQSELADKDELFEDAVRIVLESQRGSVSLLQRRLSIGYSRASRLIEQMGMAGILGDYKGSQARECNLTLEEWEALKAQAAQDTAVEVTGSEGEEDADEEAPFDTDEDYELDEDEELTSHTAR